MLRARPFPSLRITAQGFSALGAFAEAQAAFLEPDGEQVASLRQLLDQSGYGVVAHFYMDPELQGTLMATAYRHLHISDSLVMADRAVEMVAAGARGIVVLGVDFMSENVRAVLDAAGHGSVPVLRAAEAAIGCSLAESAQSPAYRAYLEQAAGTPRSTHVVYINTSLRTKAEAELLVPTITCTSSNVVSTVLSLFAQIPDGHVWFGPDSYMGANLKYLLTNLASQPDERVAALHPAHSAATIKAALPRFHYFEQGNCVVHHLFGDRVTQQIAADYADSYLTAHLEVPGALFRLGLEAARQGLGVVGSTSDILGFIGKTVDAAVLAPPARPLRFVLGTETGMVTSIAGRVRASFAQSPSSPLVVEIVFPVAADAITQTGDASLPIVPGPAGGEGCSLEGGCATCPFMKMNHLDALRSVLSRAIAGGDLSQLFPQMDDGLLNGQSVAVLGCRSIERMRAFGRDKRVPSELTALVAR